MITALLDADIIAYRCAVANQTTHDWGDTGGKVVEADPATACKAAEAMCLEWSGKAGCGSSFVLCFTGGNNFRKRLLPSYKAHRGEKPSAHAAVLEFLKARFYFEQVEGLEADDIMGILSTTPNRDYVVVTVDKDLRTIPGRLYNPIKNKHATITPALADYWWMMQTLMGDPTDGYKGCPNVGEKRAVTILGGSPRDFPGVRIGYWWPQVRAAFRERGLTDTEALTQARVARILRREDYDKSTKSIRLWHPTTPELMPLQQGATN